MAKEFTLAEVLTPAPVAPTKIPSRAEWEDRNPGGDYDAAMKGRGQKPAMAVQAPDAEPQEFTLEEALASATPAPVAQAQAQAPVAQAPVAQAPAPTSGGFLDTIGTGMNAVRDWSTGANKPKGSVLESLRGPETAAPVPEDKMLRPEFVQAVEAKLNAMPKDQRADALALMLKRPDVYGRAAKVVAARYAMLDKVVSPTAQNFDPRLEAQKARFEKQGLRPDIAEGLAKQQALSGGLRPDFDQMTPDVVGEKADVAATKRAKELQNADFLDRIAAGAQSQYTKSGIGLLQAYADLTGDKEFSAGLTDALRVEKAREGAIPEGEGIVGKSFQSAMTSLAGQAPMMVLSVVSGTTAPVLAQAAIQGFGDFYSEGRAAGLPGDKAAARAIPMAAAEVFFERLGMTKALAGLRAHVAKFGPSSIPKYMGTAIAKEIPTELATTATQYAVNMMPEIGLNKNPSLLGLYKELEETLRQTVFQAGVTAGVTVGATKGVQAVQDKLQDRQAKRYTQDTSTDGLAELMARSKGFLTPEATAPAPEAIAPAPAPAPEATAPVATEDFGLGDIGTATPGEDTTAATDIGDIGTATPGETPSAATDLGEMGAAAPGEEFSLEDIGIGEIGEVGAATPAPATETKTEAPVAPAEREARIKELALKLEDITGATEEDAIKIATQRVEREEVENVPATVPTEPVGEPDRTSTTVAEQPTGVAATEGLTESEPGGVVPTGLAPAGADVGEGTQPAALKENAETKAPVVEATTALAEKNQPVVYEKGAYIPPDEKGGDPKASAGFKVLDEDNDLSENLAGATLITGMNVASRNAGDGSRLLKSITNWADTNGKTLALVPAASPDSALGGLSQEQLKDWYARNGFEDRVDYMVREPAEAPAEAPVVNPPANEVVEQAKAAIAEIKKRGRPSLVLTPEQEASKATERKATNAANERTKRAAGKQTTALESAINTGNQTNRRAAYKELLTLRSSGTGTESVRKAIKATLEKHSNRFTPAELETLKREVADEKGVKTLPSIEGAASIAKADPKFSKFTNGMQAITHTIKTGTPFQKLVAQRIRSFVGNVNFVVLEKDSPVPDRLKTPRVAAEWAKARGLYVQNDATGERTVYLRGASFGSGHGVSNVVVLHELLHAATNQKLYLGLKALERGFSTTNAITQASKDILGIMKSAEARFNQLVAAGELPAEIRSLKEHGSIFTSPQEFLAYGMSDEAMQTFLLGAKGSEGGPSFFNRFVGAIRKILNLDKNETNDIMDLVLATDKLLSGQKSGIMRMLEAGNKALAQRSLAEPKTSKAALPPEEEAEQLDKDASKAAKTTANSRAGEELGKAVSIQAAVRDPIQIWRALSGAWDGMNDSARSRISNFFDLDAIARGPGERIPALQDVAKIMQQMSGMTQNILRSTSKIAEQTKRFYRDHPDARVAFENLVHTTTLAKYDPTKVGNTARNVSLDTAFAALPEKGQQLYRDLRDYYKAMNELQVHLVTENLDKLDIPDADRKRLIAGIREIYEKENRIEPYFPLMRHGDFILKIGKRGSANYLSMRFDTKAERERAAQNYADSQGVNVQELVQDGYIVKSQDVDGVELRRSIESSSELLKAGYAAIDAAPIGYAIDPTPVRAAMKDNLYQAYLASMPEGSTRKMFIHREGTAGFSSDVLRNLNSYGLKASKAYSKLKFGTPVRQALAAAERGLVGPEEKYRPFVTRAKEMVAEYLEPPNKTGIAQGAEQITDMVTKVSFIRNLTSWSSAMLQPADVVLKGTPILVGNHGPKALAVLSQRMKIWNQYGVVQKNADGTTTWRAPSIEFARGLTPEQRKAVRDMNAMYGVTTDTLANEIFSQARKTGSKLDSKWVENSKDAANTLIMGGLMHHGERLSREVMFLTSYDLYRGEGLPHAEAVHSAVQEVTEALGNYAAYGKPMIMRGAGGKLVTMYKFFPLITTKLLVNNFFRMLPLMNKEGKVAAATKFFGIMGTHLLAGGLTALPLFGVVMTMIGAAWDKWGRDPDAPAEMKDVDYLTWWKSVYMDKVFGSTHIADLLKTGVLNKLTGWDIASRLSLNDMWFRELPHSKNLTETAMNLGWVLAGAGASTALDIAKGVQLGINGEYQLGLEKILPASISKLMIAHRLATEGVEDTRGVKLLEKGKLPASVIAGQALGFRPANVAEAQQLGFKASAAEKVIVEEKNKIAKDIKDNFRKSIDLDKPADYQQRFEAKFEETLQKMQEFNGKHPEKAFADSAVFELILSDAELKANLEKNAGVKITPENARLLGDTVDKAIKALESYDKKEAKP